MRLRQARSPARRSFPDKKIRQQRHHRADHKCDTHHDSVERGVREHCARQAINFFLRGFDQAFCGELLSSFTTRYAASRLRPSFASCSSRLSCITYGRCAASRRVCSSLAGRPLRFRRACPDTLPHPSRARPPRSKPARRGRSACGRRPRRSGRQHAGGGQHAILHAENDFTHIREPLEEPALFGWI